MMSNHLNVSKFFLKHTNTLHCFANRCSLDESSNSIDETFFLKKIEVTSIYVFKKVVGKYASTRDLLSSKEVIDIFQIFDNN